MILLCLEKLGTWGTVSFLLVPSAGMECNGTHNYIDNTSKKFQIVSQRFHIYKDQSHIIIDIEHDEFSSVSTNRFFLSLRSVLFG